MPAILPTELLDAADAAAAYAQQVRRYHRKRSARTAKQRQADIELALNRLAEAMKPLKSQIGKFPYGPQTTLAEQNRQRIRAASQALQSERRKLWKMRNRPAQRENLTV